MAQVFSLDVAQEVLQVALGQFLGEWPLEKAHVSDVDQPPLILRGNHDIAQVQRAEVNAGFVQPAYQLDELGQVVFPVKAIFFCNLTQGFARQRFIQHPVLPGSSS